MSDESPRGKRSAKWPFAYLSVTAVSIALVVGIEFGQAEFGPTLELVGGGIVVGIYTVTTVLHWYDVAGKTDRRDGLAVDEWFGDSDTTEALDPEHVRENHD